MHIAHVVGARPNFMKAGPVYRALSGLKNVRQTLVHTGQHYDFNMSDVFFQELGLPTPTVNLQVGSGSHAQQTANVMTRFEAVIEEQRPDWVVVYGDVNSTIATALVAVKLGVQVAHVEAGLRSFDRTMPEEINRVLTDQIADLLFTPSPDGDANLAREGIDAAKVHLVGNVMIDTLIRMLPSARERVPKDLPPRFALITLHRPSNVDDPAWLGTLLRALDQLGGEMAVLFPIHPRTRQRWVEAGLDRAGFRNLRLMDPLPYLEFLGLQTKATVVITDSGGIQEETTYLGIPCLTVRDNTERPITAEMGTNIIVGRNVERLRQEVMEILAGHGKKGRIPPLWDGHAAERIANILAGQPGNLRTGRV